MIYTVAAAALLLAPQALARSLPACGGKNQACCNPDKFNFNIGTCNTADLACWEGTCMTCGGDGMPSCGGAPLPLLLLLLRLRQPQYEHACGVCSLPEV